jgi:DedD protein
MSNDAQLQKKARHRLIGAVVFVVFAAILRLMTMDAEPPETPAPILAIPLEDGMEIFTIDDSPALPRPSPEPQTAPPTTPAIAPAAPVRTESLRPTPAAASSTTAPVPSVTPPVANPAIRDADRAAAILAGRSPDVASQPAATSYVVQVTASSNMASVQDMVEKLRALRLPVYTEAAAGSMTRVRVGPYATQSEAETAERKINQDGKIVGTKIYPQ